jgi:M6 family metalloprotease-like protein
MTETRKTVLRAGAVLALFVAGLIPAAALEPPTKEQIERYRLDGTLAARVAQARAFGNHRIPQRVQDRFRTKLVRMGLFRSMSPQRRTADRLLAPPQAWEGMPTTGTVRILALLISFSDYPGVTDPSYFASRLFGDGVGGPPYDSLRNFYRRSSYDQLEITGDVLGWYQAPYARSTVTESGTGRMNLIKEALNYYEAQGHDFSQYDNDGDGTIDYFCVFWTGPHGEWASFWWGYYTWFSDSTYRLDGKRLTNYSWQWELYNYPNGTFSPSTIVHETGHALGVPDYYDYDDAVGPRGGVGNLDIMDSTGDHNCFSKFMLDWITPTVVSGGTSSVTLRASGLYPDALLFMPGAVPGRIFDEFFMVQNRMRSGNDTNLFTGSDGLLVWHVDARLDTWGYDFLYDNSYTEHKLLRLMEADGLEEIETFNASADAGDYYQAGMTFGPYSAPDSDRYGGVPTAMGITDIAGATTPISLTVFSNDAPPLVAIGSPADGTTIYGTVPIVVTASDDQGVGRVELYTDTSLRQTLTAPPFTFTLDTTAVPNGTHEIRAVVYDSILQTAQASVSVTVENIFAPSGFEAVRSVNRGLLLREYVNVLTWADNPLSTTVTKFRVYRVTGEGRALVAEVPRETGTSSYRAFHRGIDPAETYTYEVVGVGNLDREGPAATATAR